MATPSIRRNKNHIDVSVPVLLIKDNDNDSIIAYCPPLELSTYGTDQADAKIAFEEVLEVFIEETTRKGTLEKELLRMGWRLKMKPIPQIDLPTPAKMPYKNGDIVEKTNETLRIPLYA